MEDKSQILHKTLVDKQLYSKSYDEFLTQFSDDEKREKLYGVLIDKKLYSKPFDEFNSQFFPVKKKDVSEVTGAPSGISSPEQPPLPSPEKPERETTVVGDLLRTFKSTGLRIAGALGATPMMINRSITAYTLRPIVKAMGGTDEEAEYVLNTVTSGTTIGQSMLTTEMAQKPLNKMAQKTEEKMAVIEGGISDNLFKGKDGEKDVAAGFENLGRLVVGAIPYSIMTAATAGGGTLAVLGTMSATAAAQQYAAVEGMPEGKRVLNSWMYGGFEGIGEAMSAVIFRGIGRTFRAGLKKTISSTNANSFAKGVASALGLESSSEAITQIGQNFTAIVTGEDSERSLLDGALDAAIGGAAFGLVLGGGGHAGASMLGRTIASDKEVTQVQDNFKQQETLIEQIEEVDSDPAVTALKSSIRDLRVEADKVMDANYELAQKLSPEEQNKVAELYSVWNDLQEKIDTGKLTEQEIPATEKTIDGIKNQIQTIKDNLVTRIEEEAKAEKEAKIEDIKDEKEAELDKLSKEKDRNIEEIKAVKEGEKVDKKELKTEQDAYKAKVEEVNDKYKEEITKVEEEAKDAETIGEKIKETGRPQELVEGEEVQFENIRNADNTITRRQVEEPITSQASIITQDKDLLGRDKEVWMLPKDEYDKFSSKDERALLEVKVPMGDGGDKASFEGGLKDFSNKGKFFTANVLDTPKNRQLIKETKGKILSKKKSAKQEAQEYYDFHVKKAIEKGYYQQSIKEGRMAVNDAIVVIKSAGLEVPNDIISQVSEPKQILGNYLANWVENTLKVKENILKELKADYDMVLQKLKNLDLIKTDCI